MIEFVPVTEEDFPAIVKQTIQGFADECITAGRWTAAEAYDHAKQMIEADLPAGLNTPGQLFFHLVTTESQQKVGYLWLEIMLKDNLPTIFISDIEIKPRYRRQGYAESTFKAIEQFANQQNINRICLHVFRQNTAAQALYQKLGFQVTGLNLLKNLSAD